MSLNIILKNLSDIPNPPLPQSLPPAPAQPRPPDQNCNMHIHVCLRLRCYESLQNFANMGSQPIWLPQQQPPWDSVPGAGLRVNISLTLTRFPTLFGEVEHLRQNVIVHRAHFCSLTGLPRSVLTQWLWREGNFGRLRWFPRLQAEVCPASGSHFPTAHISKLTFVS